MPIVAARAASSLMAGARRLRVALRRLRGAILALPLLGLVGCSLVMVKGPGLRAKPLDCTRSVKVPVLDLTVGTAAVITGIALAATADTDTGLATGAGVGVAGVGFGVSSILGFSRVGQCRTAQWAVGKVKRQLDPD